MACCFRLAGWFLVIKMAVFPFTGVAFTVERVQLYKYSLPLKIPIWSGKTKLTQRDGLLIEILDQDGYRGLGETAPLPGYSCETLEQTQTQLFQVARELNGRKIHDGHFYCPGGGYFPSVLYGLETAFFSLQQARLEEEERFRLSPTVAVNGLVQPGDFSQLEEQLAQVLALGFRTIKLKVGRKTIKEEINMVHKISSLLPPGVHLRLDANRLWNLEQAVVFGLGIKGIELEYIEEPCKDYECLQEFYHRTSLPIALDESLVSAAFSFASIPVGVVALVLKPSRLGGVYCLLEWMEKALQKGLKPVLSSCFEAGPGFAQLLYLCSMLHGVESASGLDTLKYFNQDLFVEPLVLRNGCISLQERDTFLHPDVWRTDLFMPLYIKD